MRYIVPRSVPIPYPHAAATPRSSLRAFVTIVPEHSTLRMPTTSTQTGPARLYLLYHELRREPSTYTYAMDAVRFEQQVRFFAQRPQQPGSGSLPEITFDDGHRSDYELALPVLGRHGLKARFFITAGWTGTRARYMDWPQLGELHRAGHSIGAHGWSHRLLTQCSPTELHTELDTSRKLLEDHLSTSIRTLSLPGGRHNHRVLDACREAGYTQIYTSHPQIERDPGAFLLGRLNLRGDTSLDWLSELLSPESRTLKRIMRQDRLKQAGKSLLGDDVYARLWRLINRAEPSTDAAEADLP